MINSAWAQESGAAGGGTGNPFGQMMLMWLPILLIFYFILIRPNQKKQRERREMLSNLKKGDKVVTTGGVIGTILGTSEKTVVLKVANNVKIKLLRSAIAGHTEPDSQGKQQGS